MHVIRQFGINGIFQRIFFAEPLMYHPLSSGERSKRKPMHILMAANAVWNIWNFRRPVVEALLGGDYQITVLAPPDDAVPELEGLSCLALASLKGPRALPRLP